MKILLLILIVTLIGVFLAVRQPSTIPVPIDAVSDGESAGTADDGPGQARSDAAPPEEFGAAASSATIESSPGQSVNAGEGVRTTMGLQEKKVEFSAPVTDPSYRPDVVVSTAVTPSMRRYPNGDNTSTEPHPLDPGVQVNETGDGPRGPNNVEVPIEPQAPVDISDLPVSDLEITESVPAGPGGVGIDGHEPDPAAADELTGPGQGNFDPDSPGPDENH